MNAPSWYCCQLGAREHYAIPRALGSVGRLERLFTDTWARPGAAPGLWTLSRLAGKWRGRYHVGLARAPVSAFTNSLLAFELGQRVRGRRDWARTMARNRWFERQVVGELGALPEAGRPCSVPPVLFAYSYAALEILRFARHRGWRTVLGQIDPGPFEEELVRREHARERALQPAWQPAPAAYWQCWREECALADRIVVNSPWSLDALRRQGVPEVKMRVIPLAFEAPGGPLPSPKDYPVRFSVGRPLRVLFLGQINLRKGIARLLRAAELLAGAPVEFWLVGPTGIDRAAVPARARARLRWFGPVARPAASACFLAADVFILPTLSDGFALTQLEAMHARLPVIASRHCGPVVRGGVDGWLLPEVSAEAIAETLQACLNEPERLAEFSRATGVREEHRLSTLSQRLVALSDGG